MDFSGWRFAWIKTDNGTRLSLVGPGGSDFTYSSIDPGILGQGISVGTVLLFGGFLVVLLLLLHV